MKITHSNTYDRSAGYVAQVTADEKNLSISLFYLHDAARQDIMGDIVDGSTIHSTWADKTFVLYSTLNLDYDLISSGSTWQDRSVWTGTGRFRPDNQIPTAAQSKMWHNITAETVNSKVNPFQHFRREIRASPMDLGAFLLYVPFRDSTFDECGLHILSMIEDVPHLFNGEPVVGGEVDPFVSQTSFMPRLTITGPTTVKADDKANLSIQLTDASGNPIEHDCSVFLEAVGGYLPHPRVDVVKGKGQTRIVALSMEAGEKIRVKAGFKFWSGDAEVDLLVE